MKTIELPLSNLREIPENTPVVMLNLLRYRQEAAYPGAAPAGVRSGRDAYYQCYIPTFMKLAAATGGRAAEMRPLFLGAAVAGLVLPPDERWEEVALISYPDIAAFRIIVESEAYAREAAPHRLAALEDWRLIATVADARMTAAVPSPRP
jgi:hypothetical protein